MMKISLKQMGIIGVALLMSIGLSKTYDDIVEKLPTISALIKDSKSDYYYPNLMEKHQKNIRLSPQEAYYLYYGLILQFTYNPYDKNFIEMRNKLIEEYWDKIKSKEAIDNLLISIKSHLSSFPMDYALNNIIAHQFYLKGDTETVQTIAYNQGLFLKVISESGDGKSCDTAYYIVHINDEYNFMHNYLKIQRPDDQKLEGRCEKFTFKDNKEDIYFNIELMRYKNQFNNLYDDVVK